MSKNSTIGSGTAWDKAPKMHFATCSRWAQWRKFSRSPGKSPPPSTLPRYQREDGREPFTEWLESIRDKMAQARIRIRLRQLEAGDYGDSVPVG